MKKIITLLFACLLMTKVFAGPSLMLVYHNHTQNTGTFQYLPSMNVTANIGDSVGFGVWENCGTSIIPPYGWSFNGNTIPNTNDSIAINVIITQAGTYTAHIHGCAIGTSYAYFFVNSVTSIPSIKNINFLNVYPTAVTSSINIHLNSIKSNDIEISFFDMNGRQLKNAFYKNIVGEFIKNENTEALAKGIYFLRIKTGEGVVEKKFVKL